LPCPKTADNGITAVHSTTELTLYNENKDKIMVGQRRPGSSWIPRIKGIIQHKACKIQVDALKWHRRLGHTPKGKMEMIQRHGAGIGIDLERIEDCECRDCPVGRLTRRLCTETKVVSGLPGAHIGADLCGPIQVASLGGARYFLLIKDRVTCYRQAYFLETKEGHNVALKMREYVQMSRTRTNGRVNTLRTDNGREFVNQEMGTLLNDGHKTRTYNTILSGAEWSET
jgi:hypothetical protein